jgi:uncharacterized protein YjbJ (UPF0337 family)
VDTSEFLSSAQLGQRRGPPAEFWIAEGIEHALFSGPRRLSTPRPLKHGRGARDLGKAVRHAPSVIAVVPLIAWLLGIVGTFTIGPFVHVRLVVALVLFVVGLPSGPSLARPATSSRTLSNEVWRLRMWTKNERKGTVDQAKGKVKQAVGTLTADDDLKAEGQVDETVGKVEAGVGRTSRKTGDAIRRVGKAMKR